MFGLLAIPFPNIDPVLIEIGPVAIRWYALAYIVGIIAGFYYIRKLDLAGAKPMLDKKSLDDLMFWAIIGIMLGGRVGYVLFYNAPYYLEYPSEALAVWKGGMSFHGGLAGVILAFYVFTRRKGIPFLPLMDLVACAAPIGLFLGRIANFVNGELYGRASDVSWAMVFPYGGPQPRHPSQLYEATLEGLLLFIVLLVCVRYTKLREKSGMLSGIFLIGYGLSRAFVELFREPDEQLGFIWEHLTMGQILCVPMLLIGAYLVKRSRQASA